MKRFKKIRLVLFILVLFIITGVYFFSFNSKDEGIVLSGYEKELDLPLIDLQDAFFEPEGFSRSLNFSEMTEAENNIFSIIIPHHLVASDYIAKTIKRASGREIKIVVIIIVIIRQVVKHAPFFFFLSPAFSFSCNFNLFSIDIYA